MFWKSSVAEPDKPDGLAVNTSAKDATVIWQTPYISTGPTLYIVNTVDVNNSSVTIPECRTTSAFWPGNTSTAKQMYMYHHLIETT